MYTTSLGKKKLERTRELSTRTAGEAEDSYKQGEIGRKRALATPCHADDELE